MACGHRERVRKKVENFDIDVLEDHELIELMLFPFIPRKNVNPLAHELIESFGSLRGVLQADSNDLLRFPNMTEKAALYLPLYLKVAARANSSAVLKRGGNSSPKVIAEFIANKLVSEKFENFYAVSLDGHNRVCTMRELASGDTTEVEIDALDLVQFSISEKSRSIVIAHTHPTASPYPSQADLEVTDKLINTLKSLNITLSDHIIVSGQTYFSFRMAYLMEDGALNELTAEEVRRNCPLQSISEYEENELWKE